MNAQKKKRLIIDIIALVVLAVILGVTMIWSRAIEEKLGLLYYAEVEEPDDENVSGEGEEGEEIDYSSYPQMYVHFVDVGQGDCAIIELPDGKTVLIDGGERGGGVETAIQTFINNNFGSDFKYFDYAILTHPDSDHCGSFDYVLNKYPARVSYRPNVEAKGTSSKPYTDPGKTDLKGGAIEKSSVEYADAIKAMYEPAAAHDFTPEVRVTDPAVDNYTISGGSGEGEYSLTFYSPLSYKYGTKESNASWNDYSPIMILEYQGFRFAMSGDAEEKNLGEFVAKVRTAKNDGVDDKYDVFTDDYTVNVIKAGHHGSHNATTTEYLEAITTDAGAKSVYTVISCGAGNKYGHPHDEALNRYYAVGVKEENILRTDLLGDITFSVRVNEQGVYNLFYGDKATKPIKLALVYKTVGPIELRWALVAWVGFAVIVGLSLIYVFVISGDGGKSGGRSNSGGGRRR